MLANRQTRARSSQQGTKVCRYNWHSAGSPGWPLSVLKYKYLFSNKTYGSNFIKQHSETVMVRNYQNADCSFNSVIYYNFRHTFVPYTTVRSKRMPRNVLFCSLAVLDPRIGHTMDALSPFIPVLCHSDWLFHGESCPRLHVVHPGRAWPSSPSCTWHCSLHYLSPGNSLVSSWCDHSMLPCFDGE